MGLNKDLVRAYHKYLFPNYAPAEMIAHRGRGSSVSDMEGNEYIDFSGGIAVNALGHCELEMMNELSWQTRLFWHVGNFFTTEPALKLAIELTEKTFAEKVFFGNSGAEANECALKMARKYCIEKYSESKYEIVSALNSFHGRTLFTVSVGGNKEYMKGFGPPVPGILHAPFNDAEAFEKVVGKNTCAVILEPIQGEGGVNEAEKGFLEKIRELCDRHNALLIFDEVQCGNGRTGSLYAYQHYGVTPDVLTTGKALGGGLPFGAVLTRNEIAEVMRPGTHGSTMGGNPVVCTVALQMLRSVAKPELLKRVPIKRERIVRGIKEINETYPMFERFTGLGLLIGLRLKPEFAGRAMDFFKLTLKEGLMVLIAGPDVVRLAPALNITNDEIKKGLYAFERAAEKFCSEKRNNT